MNAAENKFPWIEGKTYGGDPIYRIECPKAKARGDYELLALLSRNSDNPVVVDPSTWQSSVHTCDGGLTCTPPFDRLEDARNCAEAMLSLNWEFDIFYQTLHANKLWEHLRNTAANQNWSREKFIEAFKNFRHVSHS